MSISVAESVPPASQMQEVRSASSGRPREQPGRCDPAFCWHRRRSRVHSGWPKTIRTSRLRNCKQVLGAEDPGKPFRNIGASMAHFFPWYPAVMLRGAIYVRLSIDDEGDPEGVAGPLSHGSAGRADALVAEDRHLSVPPTQPRRRRSATRPLPPYSTSPAAYFTLGRAVTQGSRPRCAERNGRAARSATSYGAPV